MFFAESCVFFKLELGWRCEHLPFVQGSISQDCAQEWNTQNEEAVWKNCSCGQCGAAGGLLRPRRL